MNNSSSDHPPKDKGFIILESFNSWAVKDDEDRIFNLTSLLIEKGVLPSRKEGKRQVGKMFIQFWFPEGTSSPNAFCTRQITDDFALPKGTRIRSGHKEFIVEWQDEERQQAGSDEAKLG
jgi:hypothetical protein